MLIGSLGALKQDDLKRLMAYSTINHIGFILMGLVPGSEDGVTAICIYLIFYITMNLGVFLYILNMRRDQLNVTKIKDLSGLYKTEPLIAGCLAYFLFNGRNTTISWFYRKLLILNIVIDNNLFFLAIIAVITSVISAFYYIRLVKSMFFDSPQEDLDLLANNQSKLLLSIFGII